MMLDIETIKDIYRLVNHNKSLVVNTQYISATALNSLDDMNNLYYGSQAYTIAFTSGNIIKGHEIVAQPCNEQEYVDAVLALLKTDISTEIHAIFGDRFERLKYLKQSELEKIRRQILGTKE